MSTLVAVRAGRGVRTLGRGVARIAVGMRSWRSPGVAVFVAATTYGEYASGVRGWLFVLQIVIGVLACAGLPVLFRRPVPGAIALAVLAAVAPTATPPSTIGTMHVARGRPFAVAAGVGAVGVAAHAVRGLWHPMTGLSYGWWLVLVIIAHVALVGWGALAAARAALIASLEERARRAEDEQERRVAEARAAERARIASEMHDVLAHRLSLLATFAGALEYRPDHPPERLSHAAGVIRAGAHQALEELRDVIILLREDEPDEGTQRPVPTIADLPELVEESRAAGTPVDLRGTLAEVPAATGRTAYRVVQEALTNARKHAPGQSVRVELDGAPGARLKIDIRNGLTGGVAVIPGSGTGLVGLTERVRLAGGELDHLVTSGEFRLRAWLPWPA
jgi:signal transduction histidine kinase